MNDRVSPMHHARSYALANPPRATSSLLHNALDMMAERRAQWLRHEERAWASITFAGMRHSIALRFNGAEAMEAGERFIAQLPEYEFRLPRQLVAEATIKRVNHVMIAGDPEDSADTPYLDVELEILLLDEE